jgi:hypothetical protein
MSAIMVLGRRRLQAFGLSLECLPAGGIVAAFAFAELRHVRRQLGNQATSTAPVAEAPIPLVAHLGPPARSAFPPLSGHSEHKSPRI